MKPSVIRADTSHLDLLAPLMTGYREFYGQAPDELGERRFLKSRLENNEAVIFLALDHDPPPSAVGFVQLFPSFDSVHLSEIWILHDLFVRLDAREHGVGRLLMDTAREFCVSTRARRIDLSTAVTNTAAQALYESLGYERDDEFHNYSLELSSE